MHKSIAELAREHMQMRHNARRLKSEYGDKKKIRNKKAVCSICGRDMECPEWEEGPKYCYKCEEKHEIGWGFD